MAKTARAEPEQKKGIVEKFESFVNGISSKIGSKRLDSWLYAYFHPVEAYASQAKLASMREIWVNLLSSTLISTIANTIYIYTTILSLSGYRGVAVTDVVADPVAIKTYDEMQKYVFVNMPKVDELFRGLVPYLMEQAYVIPRVVPYSATIWQPWIKNYHGEKPSGILTVDLWPQQVWVDQELKKSMGY